MSVRKFAFTALATSAAGGSIGAGLAVLLLRGWLEAGPAGWRRVDPAVPIRIEAAAGPAALPGDGWPLAWQQRLEWVGPPGEGLTVDALLPAAGSLRLSLADASGHTAFVDVGPGSAVLDASAGGCRNVDPLTFTGEAAHVTLRRRDASTVDLEVQVAGSTQTRSCLTPLGAVQTLSVQAGMRRVLLPLLEIDGAGPVRSPSAAVAMVAILGAGLLGALGMRALASRLSRWISPAILALVASPALAVLPLSCLDVDLALQQLRVVTDQPLRWPLGAPLLACCGITLIVGQARFVRESGFEPRRPHLGAVGAGLGLLIGLGFGPSVLTMLLAGAGGAAAALLLTQGFVLLAPRASPLRGVLGALVSATAFGIVALALGPPPGAAVLYASTMGLTMGTLVWVNARASRVPWVNGVSLGLFTLGVLCAEGGLGATETGRRLAGVRANAGANDQMALDAFDMVEVRRKFSKYPIGGYPVEPAPRSAPIRIVALGSSSTGGAWQNDDLSEFWPHDLGALLGPGVQVVNQGVGGWTSLHIRRYMETRGDLVDADIAVIYQGNNDSFTKSTRPYSELYRYWKQRGAGGDPLGAIAQLRLVQLARAVLAPDDLPVAAVGGSDQAPEHIAVPVADAAENLAAIIAGMKAHHGRVLLVAEGVNPPPKAAWPYAAMMADLATDPDVGFLNANEVLKWPDDFLDGCHLTRSGHLHVSRAVAAALCAENWLGANAACAPAPG